MVGNRDCYQKSSRSDAVFGLYQLTWGPLRLDLLRSDYNLAVARAEAPPLDVLKGSSAESRWQHYGKNPLRNPKFPLENLRVSRLEF